MRLCRLIPLLSVLMWMTAFSLVIVSCQPTLPGTPPGNPTVQSLPTAQADNMAMLFEQKYNRWVSYRDQIGSTAEEIDPAAFFDNEPFRELVALGAPAVPYMVAKVQQDDSLGHAIYLITKTVFHVRKVREPSGLVFLVDEFPDIRSERLVPDYRVLWTRWWNERVPQTPQQFATLYTEWKGLKEAGKVQEAAEAYQKMVDLGIVALPSMIGEIEHGDSDLIPVIFTLTDGAVAMAASREEVLAWWQANESKWTLSGG